MSKWSDDEAMALADTLEEAKSYINFGIKEGLFDPDQFKTMNEEELINFYRYYLEKEQNEEDHEQDN